MGHLYVVREDPNHAVIMQMKITQMSENLQSLLNSINQCFIVNTKQPFTYSVGMILCCSCFITQGTECSLLEFGGWYFGNEPIYFFVMNFCYSIVE